MAEEPSRLAQKLAGIDPAFAEIVRSLPPRDESGLPPDWLHLEMVERYRVLSRAEVPPGSTVLEVGSGAHAIATVPLAYLVGPGGRVVAVEIERWTFFRETLRAAGLEARVRPVACDARRLPFASDRFDLAAIVHGIRSLRREDNIVRILREMLRVAPQIVVAESLPIARTAGQKAHLEMYNLREEIFEAVLGEKDDVHYLPLEALARLAVLAGGEVTEARGLDVDQPHFLARIPREYVERIEDPDRRADLLRRWDAADRMLREHGEEHPPVGIVRASRRAPP